MNPFAKAVGTVLVLAAGTLGTSLGSDLDLGFLPPLPSQRMGGDGGNETGNQTSSGNSTSTGPGGNSTGNATGNQTGGGGGGNGTAGNQTGNATGNQTGNQTKGNETAEPEPAEQSSVCEFHVDEWGGDLMPEHNEWEWLVTRDVTHLSVEFYAYGGVPLLDGDSQARLTDGSGRTIAHTSGTDGGISVTLERGTDYMANGTWRLVYDSGDVWNDYSVSIHVGC